jgi:hypothetical protein
MNRRINFTNLGGYPLAQEDLDWMQTSYRNAFAGLAVLVGDKVIISGVVEAGGIVTNGWISMNGELLPFIGGAIAGGTFIIDEAAASLVFNDGTNNNVLFERVARFSTGGGYNYIDLVRLDSLKTQAQNFLNLLNAFNTHTHSYNNLTDLPAAKIVYKGSKHIGDVNPTDMSLQVFIPDQPNTAYMVIGILRGVDSNMALDNKVICSVSDYDKAVDHFNLVLHEVNGDNQNLWFDFIIIY